MALRQTINLVVEHHQVYVEVSAQQVNGVVATNTHAVAIATHNPHTQLGAAGFQATRYGSSTAMNAVHAKRVHVIRKTAAATNAANDGNVFLRNAQVGHHPLYLCQYAVIAATGTPAYFLVGCKIFCGKLGGCCHICTHAQTIILSIPANLPVSHIP